MAAGGGRFARALAYDVADSPAWSPDGKQIAYARDASGELWVDSDGSDPRAVTSGGDPAWSPDGSQLALADRDGIWLVAPNGQDRQLVLRSADPAPPAWSPDGRELAYAQSTFNGTQIMVANADGSNARTLVKSDSFGDDGLSWSRDGAEIAFTGASGCDRGRDTPTICEIHPDGSGPRVLATGGLDAYPSWGPAPGQLVFAQLQDDRVSRLVLWPELRTVTNLSPTPIVVSGSGGRAVAQIEPGGTVTALALTRRLVAAIVHEPVGGWALEVYQPVRRLIRLAGAPPSGLAASGTTLVFQLGDAIDALDALRGSPHRIATVRSRAIGLSIVKNRIAWAQNGYSGALIRVLDL